MKSQIFTYTEMRISVYTKLLNFLTAIAKAVEERLGTTLILHPNLRFFKYFFPLRSCVWSRAAAREANYITDLLYKISSSALLVANRTFTKTLKSFKILWPRLQPQELIQIRKFWSSSKKLTWYDIYYFTVLKCYSSRCRNFSDLIGRTECN